MATVSAPYATGTITSVTGTSVVISGGAVAGWVGRCIRMADGPAAGQIRKITVVTSATQITVDYAWTLSPFSWVTESDPASGNTFAISHLISDIVDGTTVIQDGGANSFRFVGASTFSGGAFLYAVSSRIELVSSSIAAGSPTTDATRCAFRFGDIDQFGNVYNGCYLLDTATAPSGFGTGSAAARDPDFHFYGGTVRFSGSGPFWRFHSDDNEITRMVGVDVDGNMGGRVTMTAKSVMTKLTVYNMQSTNGVFNPKKPSAGASGVISDIRVANSLQALYHFWTDSKSVSAEGIKLLGNVARMVRFANGTVSGETLTLIDSDISQLQALTNLYNNANGTYSNTFRLSQYVDASYRDAAGTAVTDTTRFVVRDNVPVATYNDTVGTGIMPRQQVRYRDMTVLNTGSFTWASAGGTTYAPYAIAAASYLNQPASAALPLTTSQNVTLLALADSYISQTNRATVDAYTTIETLDKLYDRAKAWTVDNLSAANPSFGAQVATGNGTELNLGGFNLVVDATAASAFVIAGNTLTIKASTLAAGSKFQTLRTTGTLTLSNGATMGISYTTGAGSFAAISVSGLLANTRIQIYNVTDATELYNGVASTSYSAVFAWPGVRTVRLRASKMGYMDYETTGQFLSSGVSFTADLPSDPVYVANGIDGSTVTEFTADYPNVQVDISDVDGTTSVQRLHAWYHYITESANGIANFFGGLTADDEANYRINTAVISLKLDNVLATPVMLVGARLYRDDGATVIAATSGPIHIDPLKAYTAGLGNVETKLGELYALQGLQAGSPMTVTPTSRTVGSITLAISGDGTTSTTVTRT